MSGQTSLAINLGIDANMFRQASNKNITLFIVGAQEYSNGSGGKCNLSVAANVTPTTDAMMTYSVPLSSFTLAQGCNGGGFNSGVTTPAQALAMPQLGSAGSPVYATGLTRGKTEFR